MILPNNGKVVIIDDQPNDVKELISALSKEKVPFVHYKEEDLSDMPLTPLENVRLVFLDLELVANTYVPEKNITAPIKTRLMRIMKPHTAYALVIWSKKEETYRDAILRDFEGEFKDYKPIFHTNLPKSAIISLPNALDRINKIKEELEAEMVKFKSFNAFLVWESMVNDASGKLTNEIATLYPPDGKWDEKTKYLLYKLAVAYSGKAVDGFESIKQLKNALYTLTMTFSDNIEIAIDNAIDAKFEHLISDVVAPDIEKFIPKINKLLLISESNNGPCHPGNLFFPLDDLAKELAENTINYDRKIADIPSNLNAEERDKAVKSHKSELKRNVEKVNKLIQKKKRDFNFITSESIENKDDVALRSSILNGMKGIEVNITPLCDYAQNKAERYRLLPGVMIKSEYRKKLTKTTFGYISDADFNINGDTYLLILDFRFLYSVLLEDINKRKTIVRLKQQLLSDIQVKLGSHINRAGIIYVD